MIRIYYRTKGLYLLIVEDTSRAFRLSPSAGGDPPIFAVDLSRLAALAPAFGDIIRDRGLRESAQAAVTHRSAGWSADHPKIARLSTIERTDDGFVLHANDRPGQLLLTAAEVYALFHHPQLADDHSPRWSTRIGSDGPGENTDG